MKLGFNVKGYEMRRSAKIEQDYLNIFNNLKPGSVIKLNVHPKFNLNVSEIYLLKIIPVKKSTDSARTIVAVNLKTGAMWGDNHMIGCEFEIIKEV